MKKMTSIVLILSVILSSFIFTGCENEEEDLESKISEKLTAYTTDLEDSVSTLTSSEAVSEYLLNWAKSKGIKSKADSYDNVIMTIPASEEYKEAEPVVILCPYQPDQIENSIYPMSMALYIAKNNENTGSLRVIFTEDTGHRYNGIKNLDAEYFTDDSTVISINSGRKNMWSLNTGSRSTYSFSNRVSYTKPSGNKAYRISISGLTGGIPDLKISSYPNPIKELGSLLAQFKTNAMIYDLADVSGGTSPNLLPESASIKIVINEDDYEKFEKRINKAIEKFTDKHSKKFPELSYTFEEVKMPSKVVAKKDKDKFVSLMYTLLNGVYYKDNNDELISITSIGQIESGKGRYTIRAMSNSLDEEGTEPIDSDYKIICGLSDVNYSKTDSQAGYSLAEDDKLAVEVSDAFREFTGKDIKYQNSVSSANTSYVKKKNKKADVINVAVNEDRVERYTGTVITLLLGRKTSDSLGL